MSDPVDESPLVFLRNIRKTYGVTKALDGVDLELQSGEILGLVGHNGAGKSTLVRVLCGLTTPDSGTLEISGQRIESSYSMSASRALGIRIAFQELSLAPDLRVFENILLNAPSLRGPRWARRCRNLIRETVDGVFPGNRVDPADRVERLSLAQRQMVEISSAMTDTGEPIRLLILDEPTSALPEEQAGQLFSAIKRLASRGVAIIVISHKLQEVIDHAQRVVVMRDGRVVADRRAEGLQYDQLVSLMGATSTQLARRTHGRAGDEIYLEAAGVSVPGLRAVSLRIAKGESVGLAGLEGQGQQRLLHYLWRHRGRSSGSLRASVPIAYVTGDRQAEGIFKHWSVGQNIGIGAVGALSRFGVVDRRAESSLVKDWFARLAIRGRPEQPITALSGGNQQKALVSRALASKAKLILMDDPLRGVDIETRQQVYQLVREECVKGRSFLWFTTENAELFQCDRVYVMARNGISAELVGDDISEDAVIAASFLETS